MQLRRLAALAALCVTTPATAAEPTANTLAATPPAATTASATTAAPAASTPDPWVPGTSAWGSRGMLHLDGAHPSRPGVLAFGFDTGVGDAASVPIAGSRMLLHTERLHVFYATRAPGLELGLSSGVQMATASTFVDHTVQAVSRPTLHVKYSHAVAPRLGLGARAEVAVPAAHGSGGLVPAALQLSGAALLTYRFASYLQATANLGYLLDRGSLIGGANLLAEERLALGVAGRSGVLYGAGALGRIPVSDPVHLGAFVEFSGQSYSGVSLAVAPSRATAGVKGYLVDGHLIELTLACDVRTAGRPQAGASYPGELPWTARGALSVRLFDEGHRLAGANKTRYCEEDDDCPAGAACTGRICTMTTEVIKEVVTVKEVRQENFTISGRVVDGDTQRPVQDALVALSGFEKTPLSVDYRTGNFHSFPLPTGDGLVQVRVTAPGYRASERAVPRGKANEDRELVVSMARDSRPAEGKLQGSFKDAASGRPVPRVVLFIIALQQKIVADEHGNFAAVVKAGRYDVAIEAGKYVSQRRKVVIHDGDVIILDIDLERTQKKGR